jgi:hypothetical protein
MARNVGNVIIVNQTGKIGNLCMQRNGIIRKRPDVSKRNWSPGQLAHLKRIEDAKAYARRVKDDVALSEPYLCVLKKWKKKLGPNIGVYQLAIRDFMRPPTISEIRSGHDPVSNADMLSFSVWDDFHVESVSVALLNPGGAIIEEGPATNSPGFGYRYHPKHILMPDYGYQVKVTVTDRPGNQVTKIFSGPFASR